MPPEETRQAQERIRELEAQVKILTGKATAAGRILFYFPFLRWSGEDDWKGGELMFGSGGGSDREGVVTTLWCGDVEQSQRQEDYREVAPGMLKKIRERGREESSGVRLDQEEISMRRR